MKLGYYVRWGLLGAIVGLILGVILVYENRTRTAPGHTAPYPYQPTTDISPWIGGETVVPTRVLTKHVRAAAFATSGPIDIPLRGEFGSLSVDPTDKIRVLEAIGLMRLECQDVNGALAIVARIEDKQQRDHVLHGFVSWSTDRDFSSTPPTAPMRASAPIGPSAVADRSQPASAPVTAANKAIVDERERKRRMIGELVADCKKLLAGMVDPGIQALTWSRIGRLQFFEGGDMEGATASFARAVEAAERIETKTSKSGTAVGDPATEAGTAKSDRSSPDDMPGGYNPIALIKEPFVWLLGSLGMATTLLIASIVKPIGEGVAKGLGSEQIPEVVSGWVRKLKARKGSAWKKPVPSVEQRPIESTMRESNHPQL